MMQAVVLLSTTNVNVPSRGAGNVSDARMTFDGLIGEAEAMEVSGVLPDAPSEMDPEEPEAPSVASKAEVGDLAEQDVPDLPTAEDVPVSTDIHQATEFPRPLGDQGSTTEFASTDGVMVGGGEMTPIPDSFADPEVVAAREVVPDQVGDELTAPNQATAFNAKNGLIVGETELPSDKVAIERDPGKVVNAPVLSLHDLPEMENGVQFGQVTPESSRLLTDSDAGSALLTSTVAASPSEAVVDPIKGGMLANMRGAPSQTSMGPETVALMVAAAPNADTAAALPDASLTGPGAITVKPTESGVPISVESVQKDVPFDTLEVPAAPDVPKNQMPPGPVTTDDALPKLQPSEVLPFSGEAKNQQFELTIDQSPPSAVTDADPQTAEIASDRSTDPVRPRSAIVPNVVERVAALPREVGETVIHLKPHGMGLIEVSIQQARDGGLDIVLRVQNPMVLEAMQAERQAVAQAIGGQGGAASGSLTMDLFQSGSGQRGAQGDGSGATSPGGSVATAQESLDDLAGQAETRQIIQSDHVNIIT